MKRHPVLFALLLVLALIGGAVLAYYSSEYISLDEIKRNRDALTAMIDARPLTSVAIYIVVVSLIASLLPGAALFKVAAGALFGFWLGVPIAILATTIAATLGFVLARIIGRGPIERRFGPQAARINAGVEREGIAYLLAMRFNPFLPFCLINIGMGLTRMRAATYILFSCIGVTPASLVAANAGTQLATIDTPSDILTFRIAASLVALSLMPIAGRFAAAWLRRRAARARA